MDANPLKQQNLFQIEKTKESLVFAHILQLVVRINSDCSLKQHSTDALHKGEAVSSLWSTSCSLNIIYKKSVFQTFRLYKAITKPERFFLLRKRCCVSVYVQFLARSV
jgi:hypothetical protein